MLGFIKKYYPHLLLAGLLLVAMQPLFQSGFFPIHDDEQIGRLYQLDIALKAGHIPPRLTPDLGYGYNYLLFNFYPPFVYYVAEIFHLIGFSLITSTKLMIATGFFLAALFMYLFSKEFMGKLGAIVAAVAYSYVPYHALDVYIRGALPEFWSFVFIPALFWAFYKIYEKGSSIYVIAAAFIVAFQVLTHNLVAMMSSFFLAPFFLYLLYLTNYKKKLLIKITVAFSTGMLLSAFFWIPSFLEKDHTMIELLTSELADYNLHFVYIRQFLNSPWGFGGSIYGLHDGISFLILQAIVFLAAISGLVYAIHTAWKKKITNGIIVLFALLFVFSLFIQTFHSKFIWDALPPMWYIQFPWRFLVFSAFTISFLIGAAYKLIPSKVARLTLAFVSITALIIYNAAYFQPSEYLREATDEDYTKDEIIKWKTSKMAAEYVPKGIATKEMDAGFTVVDITEDEIATKSYEVVKGDLEASVVKNLPHHKEYEVEARSEGVFRINSYAYPGWKVWVNGEVEEFSDDNKYKLISIALPEGSQTVTAKFEATQVRQIADIISLLTILAVAGYLYKNRRDIFKRHKSKTNGKNK